MSISGIQGQLLELTVVGCFKLKDTEWISRQDPYVCIEYASTKFRTRTCTDGGKNPVFQEKFVLTLIEGLREINVVVWNSNTLTFDDFIGSGKVQIQDVLTRGFDDRSWTLQTKTGRYAGEVKLIMHFANANKPNASSAPSAPPYAYAAPPPAFASHMSPASAYSAPPSTAYHPPPTAYPHPSSAYPSSSPYPYPHNPSSYPSNPYPPPPNRSTHAPPTDHSTYPPPPDHSTYPPPPNQSTYPPPSNQSTYPPTTNQSTFPPAAYPPPPSAYPPSYPPSHHAPSYPHSGNYPGLYPPPPY
ncbi:unnamed protein product [Amaranthus hypochondriacus]